MSTKDDQITASESPTEDQANIPVTDDSTDNDSPAVSAGEQPSSVAHPEVETPVEDVVGDATEEVAKAHGAEGDHAASEQTTEEPAAEEDEAGTGDSPADVAPSVDEGSGDSEESEWTTLAYGMAEGMSVDMLEGGEYSSEEYDELMALYEDTLSEIAEGEIVKARVLRKTDSAVILDVGFKSEGLIPLDEFRDPDEIEVGDEYGMASDQRFHRIHEVIGLECAQCHVKTAPREVALPSNSDSQEAGPVDRTTCLGCHSTGPAALLYEPKE